MLRYDSLITSYHVQSLSCLAKTHCMLLKLSNIMYANSKLYTVCQVCKPGLAFSNYSLSVHFNGYFFPGGPGLASTRLSQFWILLELRVMEVVVTTAKSSLPPTNQHPTFLQARCPSCRLTNSVALKEIFKQLLPT